MLTYKNKLHFELTRMMDVKEENSYDITLIVLFMPNNATEPMRIIDWYCGDADDVKTAQDLINKWGDSLLEEDINEFMLLQDLDVK